MSNLIKAKEKILEHQKLIKLIIFILALPFVLTTLNLFFKTLFQLGVYAGTFLRFLYEFVVY